MMKNKTLKDVMPREFMDSDDIPAYKLADEKVVAEHMWCSRRWPGPQKYVFNWVELESGKAVGWNENPARGWSFPVIKLSKDEGK